MSAVATTEQPLFLSSHAYEQDLPPSIADGVAGLLALDRQIIIVTGKTDGRMAGFLADLTHGISRRGSLLRIKSPLKVDEFHAALAGQLRLPPQSEAPAQLAARVGQRLQQPAPKGRYVLLCEAADQYDASTLEAIRQISNYPVSIVLVGAHILSRRLRRASLAPLRQRVTHQLALNRRGLFSPLAGAALLATLVVAAAATHFLTSGQRIEDIAPPRPISVRAATPVPEPTMPAAAPVLATEIAAQEVPAPEPVITEPALHLHLDYDLSAAPGVAETKPRP